MKMTIWLVAVGLAFVGAATGLAAQEPVIQPLSDVTLLRASTSLQNALDGRALAGRFLCGDESRLRQVEELDDRLQPLLTRYQQRFGRDWQGSDQLPDRSTTVEQVTGRRVDCVAQDSFYAGLTDYQNGLNAARGVLGADDGDYNRPRQNN